MHTVIVGVAILVYCGVPMGSMCNKLLMDLEGQTCAQLRVTVTVH